MLIDYLIKFIGYFNQNGNVSSFSDGLGEGSYGWRHFLWIVFVIVFGIIGYLYFKKHPQQERKVVLIMVISLFIVRLTNQTVRAIIGVEVPWTKAFPFHMCTVLTFLLPLTVFFRWNKIKTAVYVLSMMGGIITLLIGDYFSDRFMTFFTLEGMSAHTILIFVPIFEVAAKKFDLAWKNSWQVIVGILILMGWATLANEVFFVGTDPNYMYLKENALPFGNEKTFFFYYVIIFFVMLSSIYGLPYFLSIIRRNKSVKELQKPSS